MTEFELLGTARDARSAWTRVIVGSWVSFEVVSKSLRASMRQAYTDAGGVPSMAQFAAAVEDAEREARGKNARDRIRPSSPSACSRTDQETPSRRLGRTGQSST
jgi:hypothetical protein